MVDVMKLLIARLSLMTNELQDEEFTLDDMESMLHMGEVRT